MQLVVKTVKADIIFMTDSEILYLYFRKCHKSMQHEDILTRAADTPRQQGKLQREEIKLSVGSELKLTFILITKYSF